MLDCRTLRHGSAEYCMEKDEPLQPSRTSTLDMTPPPIPSRCRFWSGSATGKHIYNIACVRPQVLIIVLITQSSL